MTTGADVEAYGRELFVLLGAHEEHDVTATHPRVPDRNGVVEHLWVGHHPTEQTDGQWGCRLICSHMIHQHRRDGRTLLKMHYNYLAKQKEFTN